MTTQQSHGDDSDKAIKSLITDDHSKLQFSRERASRIADQAMALLRSDEIPTREDLCVQKLEAGLFLKDYRLNEGRSLDDVLRALQERSSLPAWISPKMEFLRRLEELDIVGQCPLPEVYPLAEAYGMPLVMLDSLLSAPEEDVIVKQSLRSFIQVGSLDANRQHGSHCQYSVPQRRLKGTDAVVVQLLLEPHFAVSDVHDHPGDELIFVLEGNIQSRLHSMGISQPLGKGDYAHYFAEQPHSVINNSAEPARVLIVRFYQLLQGTRRRVMDAIKSVEDNFHCGNTEVAANSFLKEIRPHLSQVLQHPIRRVTTASKIHDAIGLGRFLQQVMRDLGYGADDVIRLARQNGWNRSDDEIAQILNGQEVRDASHEDMNAVANILGIPTIVFANYMFPAVANCVFVRRDEDLLPIPGAKEAEGRVEYSLPCRTLAGSDIAITYLKLAPDESSPWNVHPGHELVLPLSGTVKVMLEEANKVIEVSAQREEYAHYESNGTHCVRNDSGGPAELFIIRFYRLDDDARERRHETHELAPAGRIEGLPAVPFLAECEKDTKYSDDR